MANLCPPSTGEPIGSLTDWRSWLPTCIASLMQLPRSLTQLRLRLSILQPQLALSLLQPIIARLMRLVRMVPRTPSPFVTLRLQTSLEKPRPLRGTCLVSTLPPSLPWSLFSPYLRLLLFRFAARGSLVPKLANWHTLVQPSVSSSGGGAQSGRSESSFGVGSHKV